MNALEKAGSGLWQRAPSRPASKASDYQREEAIKRRADGETLAAISRSYGVSIAMTRGCDTRRSCSATARHRRYARSAKCYMNMRRLYAQQFSETGAVA